MNYQQTLEYLYEQLPMYQRTGAAAYKANLDNTIALDSLTGHPHRAFRSVHIAGTNGKGSVSHMLASILQAGGLRTGLYTSPHLLDFRERIRINGKMIDRAYVTRFIADIKESIDEISPSFFELTVAMAFSWFREESVDIAVIETGMGGRLDSTNIVTPLVSVITNISLDHTRFLGGDIPTIAAEKAGIIKPGIPVVTGATGPVALKVIETTAAARQSAVYRADRNLTFEFQTVGINERAHFHYRDKNGTGRMIETDLSGAYQAENLLTALETIRVMGNKGIRIREEDVAAGLTSVRRRTGLRGRWETIGANPRVICDTAHNPAGIACVMTQLSGLPSRNLHIIWGMVSDKPLDVIFDLLPAGAVYYLARADVPRAMDPAEMAIAAAARGLKHRVCSTVGEAIGRARSEAGTDDVIFIGGSTFTVADALNFIPESGESSHLL